MKKVNSLTLILFASFLAAACSKNKAIDSYQDQEQAQRVIEASDEMPEILVKPKVDILFVIDTSKSMEQEIKNLSENIKSFSKAFTQIDQIDFHIGVVTIWDSIRYQDPIRNPNAPVAQFMTVDEDGVPVTKRNFWGFGELLPLESLSPEGEVVELSSQARFVSNQTLDLESTLAQTLLMDPPEYNPGRDDETNEYVPGKGVGPEFEELFSPVQAVFAKQISTNAGFSRSGAHKVVVFLTDADDESIDITATQMDKFMRDLTGDQLRRRFSTYSVMYPNGRTPSGSCKADPGLDDNYTAQKLTEFMNITQGQIYSICDKNFGESLAQMGESIRQQTLSHIVVDLNRYPEFIDLDYESLDELSDEELNEHILNNTWLLVTYGDQIIPPQGDGEYGWSWDRKSNSLIIEGVENFLEPVDGAEFKIQFTGINMKNVRNGGVKQKGDF